MDIPDTINNKFKELKESFPFHIVLKRLNGTYYVYRQTSTWVKELKKPKTEAEYLGKINNDGTFIKKLKEKEDEIRNAKEIIEAHGGKVFLPEVKNPIKITKSTDIERKILKILSMNGRASYSFIGKLTGLTASAAYNRVKILEKKYDISYIPEIDAQKLGYLSYIVFIKLIDNKLPPVKELKNVLENEPRIQLAITTTGDYDLILFFLAKDNRDVNLILLDIQSKSVFKDYAMKWNITPNFDAYCFIPFREKFLELLGYENSYGSVSLKVKNANISEREKKVLKELNKDGRMSFTAIDRKYSLNHGASQYAYYSLVKKNILRRITITETNLQIKYNVIFLSQIIYGGIASSTRTSLLLATTISYFFSLQKTTAM